MKETALNLNLCVKKICKQLPLDQMEYVAPWFALVELIAEYYPLGEIGIPPFSLQTKLRVNFTQPWFTRSDPAMEQAFFASLLQKDFARTEIFGGLSDVSSIRRLRHQLEKHEISAQILATVNELLTRRGVRLNAGAVVDATLIAASTRTKNCDKSRYPDMHSSKKGNQWCSA